MTQIHFMFISGVMLGFELIDKHELEDPNFQFGIVMDLLIFRCILYFYKDFPYQPS